MLNVKGKKFALQPGMALNAQIKLQKRTILQLLFSAFNQSWILYVQFVNSFLFHLLILYQPT